MYISDCDKRIAEYLSLQKSRPELFDGSDGEFYPLELNSEELVKYEEETGKKLGLVFDNSPYWIVLADKIRGGGRYARIVYKNRESNGCVIVPCCENAGEEPKFGVLENFRHAPRAFLYEFPRGFVKDTPYKTVISEFEEELDVSASRITEVRPIGKTCADSGLTGGSVDVYLVKFSGKPPRGNLGHEGIRKVHWMAESELQEKLGSEIRDGFTMSAYLLYKLGK